MANELEIENTQTEEEAAKETSNVITMEAVVSEQAETVKEHATNIDEAIDEATTYITKGTKIKGDIETDGSIDVIGSVEGDIVCKGKIVISGLVTGCVSAGEVYSNAAKINGDIESSGSVKVGVGSVIVGRIVAESAVIAGAVNGDLDVKGPVIVDSTAIIMGNIKSRSVQINNGAVIEGFCSQSYSDIDVKSFFA